MRHIHNAFITWIRKSQKPLTIGFSIAFLLTGPILNSSWKFPYFYCFVAIFLVIGFGAHFAEKKYVLLMNDILADVVAQPPFSIARTRYLKWAMHPINKIIPIGIILLFGVGGCSIYLELSFTPTFIWCLLVFGPVVFISIKAYLKYIYLAMFLFYTSSSTENYEGLPIITSTELPSEIDWRRRLGKLISIYQRAFFGLGSLYVTAFALFCFRPEFGVANNAPVFYLLWGVIFLAIVVTFPIISLLELHWFKKIEQHLKKSYLDLWRKSKLPFEKSEPLSELLGELIRNKCLAFVFPVEKKGFAKVVKLGYTFIAAAFNFVISVITILQFFEITSILSF